MQFTWIGVRPYLALIFVQFGLAGLSIIAKLTLNHGMSHYSFVVYRQSVATILISPFALLLERYVPILPNSHTSCLLALYFYALFQPFILINFHF